MTQIFSSPQVLCRSAIESDCPDIAKFCKNIRNGHDYVPEVWHDWFKDPQGLLATAKYDSHAIGCSHLALLADGQWWLEGFRVVPQYQGLKVGSGLHDYVSDWGQEHCDGMLRIVFDLPQIVSQIESAGYTKHWEHNAFVFEKKHPVK